MTARIVMGDASDASHGSRLEGMVTSLALCCAAMSRVTSLDSPRLSRALRWCNGAGRRLSLLGRRMNGIVGPHVHAATRYAVIGWWSAAASPCAPEGRRYDIAPVPEMPEASGSKSQEISVPPHL